MSEIREHYKFKNKQQFLQDIKPFVTQKNFASACEINVKVIQRYISNNVALTSDNAVKVAKTLGIEFDDMFEKVNVKEGVKYKMEEKSEKDKTDMIISEEILCGLKRNIEDRLLVSHSKVYVKEIMSVVDQLVIEGAYLGVHCHEKGKHQFILNAIAKRRKETL